MIYGFTLSVRRRCFKIHWNFSSKLFSHERLRGKHPGNSGKLNQQKTVIAVTILSFPFWTIFISQVPPFLLKDFFTRYYTRFEANHKLCPPSFICVCVCFYMSFIFKKKERNVQCTCMYIYGGGLVAQTRKHDTVYIDQYRFLPLTIWNLIIPKSCVRVGLQRELINKSLIRVW